MGEVPFVLPVKRGDSNREIRYVCDACGRDVGSRDNLVAKRVSFRRIGRGGSDIKSRTTAWLCIIPNGPEKSCRDKDPDWNRGPYEAAPGMRDTKRASRAEG